MHSFTQASFRKSLLCTIQVGLLLIAEPLLLASDSPGELVTEIGALRSEIALLRQDVRELIDVLQSESAQENRSQANKSFDPTTSESPASPDADREYEPALSEDFTDLTLTDAKRIILANRSDVSTPDEAHARDRNLLRNVELAYWDLHSAYKTLETARQSQAHALEFWRSAKANSDATDAPPETEARARCMYFQCSSFVHSVLHGSSSPDLHLTGLYDRERRLRKALGWAANDGRLIRPSDLPTLTRLNFDWDGVLMEAIEKNPDLVSQRSLIAQLELELAAAKNQILPQVADVASFYHWLGTSDESDRNRLQEYGDTESPSPIFTLSLGFTPEPFGKRRAFHNIQNATIQLKKYRETLAAKKSSLAQELSLAWRNLDSLFVSIRDYLEQSQANEVEIRILEERLQRTADGDSRLADKLLRAYERQLRVRSHYYQAVAEYNKSITDLHYLKGTLGDGSTSPNHME